MKALIFGAGRQAEGVAWYLANHSDFEEIGILSRSPGPIDEIMEFIDSDKLKKHVGDVLDEEKTKEVMKEYDVGINALPTRQTSYKTIELAADVGLDMIDILEEYHRSPDPYEMEDLELPEGMAVEEYGEYLHELYVEKGIMLLDGMGFAPGLTNITLGEALREMDEPKTAIARCGGIPNERSAERHPLKYMITWTFDHVLREYNIKSMAIKNGERTEFDALSLQEKFLFDKFGKNVELECAVTPGMPSFVHTRSELENTYEKTVRWPGHYDTIKEFRKCGMLDIEPVEVNGCEIMPREVLLKVLVPKLKPKEGDRDACAMWNTAEGKKDGKDISIDYYMWDDEDVETGLTAMQRTTCFPPAIASEMMAKNEVSGKGIIAPEDCITGPIYEKMIARLEDVGIEILKEITF
ncbi:MAG: saccharopine dehydrogenase C-terminal domain-containing protein [Thermoplasmata archaeon]